MSGSWGIGCLASDVTKARQELEKLKKDTGYLEPDRGNLDDTNIEWKYGKPDYTMVNLEYMKVNIFKSVDSTEARPLTDYWVSQN
ncbi:Hypp4079 [Branchiostoma lanceolatum]|uniref:Hypp4079 protein n=1 Tax=Branchiostoma lanceolatum TaxID=7740 RepID=A0A8K0A573_BRALA|nr:Hypp4079 [Branchiostoma lanceolatum]